MVLRRQRRAGSVVLAGATALVLIIVYAISSYGLPFTHRSSNDTLHGMLVFAPLVAAFAVLFVREGRLRRRVIRTGGAICLRCGYELPARDARGVCPECGTEYVLADTQTAWAMAFPLAQRRLRRNHAARVLGANNNQNDPAR